MMEYVDQEDTKKGRATFSHNEEKGAEKSAWIGERMKHIILEDALLLWITTKLRNKRNL